jgi:RNA polymerase sigma factor (sigma-70 family)
MAKGNQGLVRQRLETLLNEGAFGGLSDAELLERFTSRRDAAAEQAFAALVDRHGPMVLRVCRAVLRDAHDAHDAFQATFLVLVRKARGLWVRESLGPWLHQVAQRTACRARTVAARRRWHERMAASLATEATNTPEVDHVAEIVHAEVGRLSERYRAVVVLCLMEGLTPEHAARRLGCPPGTVHSRLARGRERLRRRLMRRGISPAVAAIGAALSAQESSAAIRAALADSTVRAATRFGISKMAKAGGVPPSVTALTEEVMRMMLVAKLKTAAYFVVALGILFGVSVLAQRSDATPPVAAAGGAHSAKTPQDGRAPSAEKKLGFDFWKPTMAQFLEEHGSFEVTWNAGTISARVRVESLEDLARARPLLERIFEQEGYGVGWIDRVAEVKAEIAEATGKVPDPLAISQELRLREMEQKLNRLVKALDAPKRDRGQ